MRAVPLALALLLIPFAAADGDVSKIDGDGERRKLVVDADGDKATIKLEREGNGTKESVKVEYDARKASLQVKHESKDKASKEEEKLQARFLAVLEFEDADADGAYDAGEPVASAWALSSSEGDSGLPVNGTVSWGDVQAEDIEGDGVAGKHLSARATFGASGRFGLDLYAFGDFAQVGAAELEPTEVKVDILVEGYPFVRNGTMVAVLADLKAKSEFKDRGSGGEGGLAAPVANASHQLTFTWLETAEVDGAEQPVGTTILRSKEESSDGKSEQKARIAFAYPRGDLIVHDPTIGVAYLEASKASPLGAEAIAGLAAVGIVVAARRRRAVA